MMGFDPEAGAWMTPCIRSPSGSGAGDVRITTRWDEHYFPAGPLRRHARVRARALRSGHPAGLSAQPAWLRRVPGHARVPEPHVGEHGRPRAPVLPACWHRGWPAPRRRSGLHQADDAVPRGQPRQPSFIRVEADEPTYALHIVLRFELEQELIEGRLAVGDLPEAWNAASRSSLGITVTDDADGVLQDVHWSAGLIGYFPTYALGNLIAGQLWERVHLDVPDLDEQHRRRRARPLREWLRRATFTVTAPSSPPPSCCERAVGGPIAVAPFTRYLKRQAGRGLRAGLRRPEAGWTPWGAAHPPPGRAGRPSGGPLRSVIASHSRQVARSA